MKRDFDLIRKILFEIEDVPAGETNFHFDAMDGYDLVTVNEHIELLEQAGLIKAAIMRDFSGICAVSIQGLTWQGHDFLDAARNDTLWNKAKEKYLKPGMSVTFDILFQWLKSQI